MRSISNCDDTIDTREIIARIDDIELDYTDDEGEPMPLTAWDPADAAERETLSQIIEEVGDQARDGVTLIRYNHFRDYMRDWHEETYGGDLYREGDESRGEWRPVRLTWSEIMAREPFNNINWDAVARDAESDHTPIEWDGVTYYYAH